MNERAQMSWIFDYLKDQWNMDFFKLNSTMQTVNMTKFRDFITTFPYKAWQSGVHYQFKEDG